MSTDPDPLNGELPVDADLGPANDDVVEKGDDAEHDDLDDVEEVLPQGGSADDDEPLP